MDDQLNSGPDLQSAEDEDVDYDLVNNSSDNDEDWADRMREFHVSASALRYVLITHCIRGVYSLKGKICNGMARHPSFNMPQYLPGHALAFLTLSKIHPDAMSFWWMALTSPSIILISNGLATYQMQSR